MQGNETVFGGINVFSVTRKERQCFCCSGGQRVFTSGRARIRMTTRNQLRRTMRTYL